MSAQIVSTDARLERLASGLQFTEGPVWLRTGVLVFSDIPANEMKSWSPESGLTSFRSPSHQANGNTLDREGRLITCEHQSRRVTRTEQDGSITVLVDSFEGKRFNSPNDVVVKSDGTIWFTDPPYGLPKHETREMERNNVFCLDPATKTVRIVAGDMPMPNGLCFSPDESLLYIANSDRSDAFVRVYEVTSDNTLVNGRRFTDIAPGVPDGMRCDTTGRLWTSAGDGVYVHSADAILVSNILVPETPSNLCFGGEEGQTLFITARTSLYSIRTSTKGALRQGSV